LSHATRFPAAGPEAAAAIDGDPQTGWSVGGGGQAHLAVFNLAKPLAEPGSISLSLLFERYHAADLGRFRISVTAGPGPVEARLPVDIEELLLVPASERTDAQRAHLLGYYASVAPELAAPREEIKKLRAG